MVCPEGPGIPVNGNTLCSDGVKIGSSCDFTCNPGFILAGEMDSECVENESGMMVWSYPVPECQGACNGHQKKNE